MRLFRSLGLRLVVAVIVVAVMGVVWVVNSIQRNSARGEAAGTVTWFYKDARFATFPSFVQASKDYLIEAERESGRHLKSGFGTLDLDDFCNEFDGDGVLCPEQLSFKTDSIVQQDNNGSTAHVLVSGKVLPQDMKRGRTTYSFSDDTFEEFAHLVTLTNQGGRWYITQVVPQ